MRVIEFARLEVLNDETRNAGLLNRTLRIVVRPRATGRGAYDVERRVHRRPGQERRAHLSVSMCGFHGSDLHATDPEVPDLTDDGFKYGWMGKTVANRFRNIRTAMPAGAPGSLNDQTYIDIVAYILQFNGMPPGNQKLMPEVEALEKIVIAAP